MDALVLQSGTMVGVLVAAVASLVVAAAIVYHLLTTNPWAFLKVRDVVPGIEDEEE